MKPGTLVAFVVPLSALALSCACNLTEKVRTRPGAPGTTTTGPRGGHPKDDAATDGGMEAFPGFDSGPIEDAAPDAPAPFCDPVTDPTCTQSAVCGDGVIDRNEKCDPGGVADAGFALGGQTCEAYGFTAGALHCKKDCTLDFKGCIGVEDCADGRDDDGDGLVDCDDSDCAAFCADPCSDPPLLVEGRPEDGSTERRLSLGDPSCTPSGSTSGGALPYKLVAANTGMLDVSIVTGQTLDVSIRTSCATPADELVCSMRPLSVPVTQGETVYIIVAGLESFDSGPFTLTALTREIKCGDGIQDPSEECDDSNTKSGDGCSSTCVLESTEVEPNETAAQATPYVSRYFAQISEGTVPPVCTDGGVSEGGADAAPVCSVPDGGTPVPDVDMVSVQITGTKVYSFVARTKGVGVACAAMTVDTVVDILAADGTTVLKHDDGSGGGYCGMAVLSGMTAGTYYVRVTASPFAPFPTFPYELDVELDPCGNGTPALGEECDDGNVKSGDGCSSTCKIE